MLLVLLTAWTVPLTHAASYRGRSGGYREARPASALRPPSINRKPAPRLTSKHASALAFRQAADQATRKQAAVSKRLSKIKLAPPTVIELLARQPGPIGEFMRGVLRDGPKHMWHSMVKRPAIFFGGLIAVGTIGALGAMYDLHTEPAVVVAGIAALAIQLWSGLKIVRQAPPHQRARAIGAELAFPTLVWAGSSAAAMSLGHGATTSGAGDAAAKAMLFGGEAPANLSMATRGAKPAATH
ncbi:MAG: hypothetical protein IPL79_00165 [Myxococcales bacterium]|nr:hypothetical protein [Myxococcales bacterium]